VLAAVGTSLFTVMAAAWNAFVVLAASSWDIVFSPVADVLAAHIKAGLKKGFGFTGWFREKQADYAEWFAKQEDKGAGFLEDKNLPFVLGGVPASLKGGAEGLRGLAAAHRNDTAAYGVGVDRAKQKQLSAAYQIDPAKIDAALQQLKTELPAIIKGASQGVVSEAKKLMAQIPSPAISPAAQAEIDKIADIDKRISQALSTWSGQMSKDKRASDAPEKFGRGGAAKRGAIRDIRPLLAERAKVEQRIGDIDNSINVELKIDKLSGSKREAEMLTQMIVVEVEKAQKKQESRMSRRAKQDLRAGAELALAR